ncbi:MAG: hypothetical protein Q8O14_13530 [bacterium]|nr:hypothetical protein [bacterium]
MNTPATITENLPALDLDLQAELDRMTEGVHMPLPRVRVEHSPSGQHRLFLDLGPTIDDDDLLVPLEGNSLSGIVVAHQHIRAVFEEGSTLPVCASVNGQPTVDVPQASACDQCPLNGFGSKCKPKVRLLVLAPGEDGEPALWVFPLSPTSIKQWHRYVQRLARSKVPYLAVRTRFELKDIQRPPYRYAEVLMSVDRLITQEELAQIKAVRETWQDALATVVKDDYQDPGDATNGEA